MKQAALAGALVTALALYAGIWDADGMEARDLAVYLAAARVWLDGGDPLQCASLRAVAEAPLGGCFVSPAWTLFPLAPLGPLSVVTTPWRAVASALVGLGAALWCASLPADRQTRGLVATAVAVAALFPTLSTLIGGNQEPIVVAALGAAALAVSRGASGLAGALIGLAGAVKVLPWALVAGLPRRGWAAVGGAIGAVVVTDLLMFGAVLPGARAAAVGDSDVTQATLLGVVRVLRGSTGRVDAVELGAWAALTAGAVGLSAWRLRGASADTVFRLATLTLLVCLPRGWQYVWLGLIGPVAATWAQTPASVLGALGALLLASPWDRFSPWWIAALTWAVALGAVRPRSP